ncbi:ABC transporter ATP-binding protein [Actinobaculum sp. 352]|uniref:ABC transporter ATP-binding protein n=1 Tax=Actinobaculum sp. 352 TaxID=2490946 RepID=UPI0019D2B7CF|nr:ABC transporter ATP-binding protein [Actinobaculum sp. 352]
MRTGRDNLYVNRWITDRQALSSGHSRAKSRRERKTGTLGERKVRGLSDGETGGCHSRTKSRSERQAKNWQQETGSSEDGVPAALSNPRIPRGAPLGSQASAQSGPPGDPRGGSGGEAPAVAIVDLTRAFRVPGRRAKVTAVNGVSFELMAGSYTALVGASGCGKSTLMQCIAGLDVPDHGSVRLLGTEITRLRPRGLADFRAEHVGFVFQDDNLVTSLSVRDNVALPGRLRHRPLPGSDVDRALERVGLRKLARRLPGQLSGGERQRVAIARVLASRPAIVFADEPTAALDVGSAGAVLDWFAELAAAGTTVLMVTHDAAAAARAESALVMDGGRLIEQVDGGDAGAIARAVLAARNASVALPTGGAA